MEMFGNYAMVDKAVRPNIDTGSYFSLSIWCALWESFRYFNQTYRLTGEGFV